MEEAMSNNSRCRLSKTPMVGIILRWGTTEAGYRNRDTIPHKLFCTLPLSPTSLSLLSSLIVFPLQATITHNKQK